MLLFDEQTQIFYAYTPEPAADFILCILVAKRGFSKSQTRISGFSQSYSIWEGGGLKRF